MDSVSAAAKLKEGLQRGCADDIVEVLCNLADGTCDAVELIPLLRRVAAKDQFCYFDDNSAGGFPHASGEPSSFRDWTLKAIENIESNARFAASAPIARLLKSLDTQVIKSALRQPASSTCRDETLIPILEKIARKDKYHSYSYVEGYSREPRKLGETARRAIQQIRKNIAESGECPAPK